MVKPARASALPKQPGREAEQLQAALEAARRRDNARPTPVHLVWRHNAESSPGATSTETFWHQRFRAMRIVWASLVCETSETADASNYARIILQAHDPDAGTSTKLGTLETSQIGFTVHVPRALELDANLVPAGHTLRFVVEKVGTGVQLGDLELFVEGEEQRA